jgi:formylglycine-generating enzyme required for sulfatase activity
MKSDLFAITLTAATLSFAAACSSHTDGAAASPAADSGEDALPGPATKVDAAADTGSVAPAPSDDGNAPEASNPTADAAVLADADEDGSAPEAGAEESGDAGMGPRACGSGMVAIAAKNQSFMMGFAPSEAPGTIWACYLGKHKVTFTYDFCMDANLVTQAEFSSLMGFNPSKHLTTDSTLPVDSETWYDAMLYCNKKSQVDGLQAAYSYGAVTLKGKSASNVADVAVDLTKSGYRLPTNAEYEYVERADTTGLYFFSPTATSNITALGAVYAWYSGNSQGVTQPVGLRKVSPWGLYDIVGNLFEWENDWEGPYLTTDQVDPVGPATGTGCGTFDLGVQKMAKGGSWRTDVETHMRISYHFKWAPSFVGPELGFRCVATSD